MPSCNILVLPGDGVDPEIIAEAIKVLELISNHSNAKFNITQGSMDGRSIDKHGVALTDEVLDLAKKSDAVLFGAVGGPKWGAGKVRPEQGVLRLRKELNAFANLCPCQFASASLISLSPLKPEVITDTDFIIVRENCGGAYFGNKIEEEDFPSDPWQYSRGEVEKVARVAVHLAIELHKSRGTPLGVIICDKANVLFLEVKLEHQLADSAAMMLRYSLGLVKEATAIEKAVEKVLDSKDIGGLEIRTRKVGPRLK